VGCSLNQTHSLLYFKVKKNILLGVLDQTQLDLRLSRLVYSNSK